MYFLYDDKKVLISKHTSFSTAKKKCERLAEDNNSTYYVLNKLWSYGTERPVYVWDGSY